MIYDFPIGNIVENDIKILIDEHVGEQKYLEYKRMLPDHTNESKHNFLATVVSFANTQGGLIIYGIKENDNGEAEEVVNINSENTNTDSLRLLQLIQDGIEPRTVPPEIRELFANGLRSIC